MHLPFDSPVVTFDLLASSASCRLDAFILLILTLPLSFVLQPNGRSKVHLRSTVRALRQTQLTVLWSLYDNVLT